jgi:hypothetical protein
MRYLSTLLTYKQCLQLYALVLTAVNARSLSMVLTILEKRFLQPLVMIMRNGINKSQISIEGILPRAQVLKAQILPKV